MSARWLALIFMFSTPLGAGELEPARAPRKPIQPLPAGVTLAAVLTDARLDEVSGLAISRRHPGIVWVHNDSQDAHALYAVDTQGRVRATLELPVPNIDWEDIASYQRDGRSYLLVADTGDNGGIRKELVLHEVPEPAELRDQGASTLRSIRFRWPDGARDCEALAVDVADASIWLISKKRVPPQLFRLPLLPAEADAVQVAEFRGQLAGIVQPSARDLSANPVYGKYRSQITAADISADGQRLAVMSYQHLYLWPRHLDGWPAALAQAPTRLDLPWMAQAEAMGFDASGATVWISSEHLPAPLIRHTLGH
ncbi:MAG: hypothetical protein KDI69_02715 [Xanthomonadales bacterium]|nr:hypothetical protein [Xanthomonadales bacterium]